MYGFSIWLPRINSYIVQIHRNTDSQNSFSVSLTIPLERGKKNLSQAIINLFESCDRFTLLYWYICAIDLLGVVVVVLGCFVALMPWYGFFLLAYIRFWVCTNASQCVVVFVSFSNKNIVFYLFYFSSFFGTRSVGQGRNESANIIFWFRLHFCFELHAMIISVLSLWVHSGVCIFFHRSCVPWLYQNSSLYVLCQLSLFVSAHHVYMYLVIYGCACSSRSCVHVLPYIWMMWMYISYEPKQSSNERVENEYANHSQVKSVCKSNLKIILSR